eukprot:CAMPEP_0118948824 /NCGR_PEP_ID=MMETSP1169-20130426/48524_1 /TAXON_ID=36882 /ORGANISM="Pyramimonas obovata, Strain CCMP722" /LENGTH=210 /DNA_ID=CAMNT_0006895339 /DNA_START=88 /DNA_END=716 /DNA_ORIENTATION=+
MRVLQSTISALPTTGSKTHPPSSVASPHQVASPARGCEVPAAALDKDGTVRASEDGPQFNGVEPHNVGTRRHIWYSGDSSRRVFSISALSIVASALLPSPSSAKIVVPPQTSSRNLQAAQKRGEERLAELEAERGEVIYSPFGFRYREERVGTGEEVDRKRKVYITYKLFQANGTYIDSVGYGLDSRDDVGEAISFRYGAGQVPLGLEVG